MTIHIKDAYQWSVVYHDDTYLREFDAVDTIGRGWAEIGEKPVKETCLFTSDPNLNYGHKIMVPTGATPIFFRRRRIELNPLTEQEQGRTTVHCIGWKRDDEAVYLFIFDDGSTLLTNDLQAV